MVGRWTIWPTEQTQPFSIERRALQQLDERARYVFGTAAGLSLSAALLEVILWRRMVPHPAIEEAAMINAVASRSSTLLRP